MVISLPGSQKMPQWQIHFWPSSGNKIEDLTLSKRLNTLITSYIFNGVCVFGETIQDSANQTHFCNFFALIGNFCRLFLL